MIGGAETEVDPAGSQVQMRRLRTAKVGSLFASDIGMFGVKPPQLSDALAGLRCHVSTSVKNYMRSFGGEQSSSDFETSLRMVHQLFRTEVKAVDDELKTIKQIVREAIQNQIRDPVTKYVEKLKFVNYGKSFYFRPWTLAEFDAINAEESCEFFSECFQHPGEFTVIVLGDLDEIPGAANDEGFLRLMEKYLGSVVVPSGANGGGGDGGEASSAIANGSGSTGGDGLKVGTRLGACNTPMDVSKIVPIPFNPPEDSLRETVRAQMVDPISMTQVTVPVGIQPHPLEHAMEESFWITFCCTLLENRLMREMRFSRGEIYSVSVSLSFAVESPSFPTGRARGDMAISFSCEPGGDTADKLAKLAVDEVRSLRKSPVAQEEVDSMLETERRGYEVAQEENAFWQDCLITACQSRKYRETKDLDAAYVLTTSSCHNLPLSTHSLPYTHSLSLSTHSLSLFAWSKIQRLTIGVAGVDRCGVALCELNRYTFKEETRKKVISSITPETMREAFTKFFKEDFAYTAITLEPEQKQPQDGQGEDEEAPAPAKQ